MISTSARIPGRAAVERYRFVHDWRLDARPEDVWAVLWDVEGWPGWWPSVKHAEVLAAGDAQGVGRLTRLTLRSRLGWRLTFATRLTSVQPLRSLRAAVTGELEGTGDWELAAVGTGTVLRYRWSVSPTKRWMRLLAPVAAPVFRWTHDAAMAEGEAGIRRQLAAHAGTDSATRDRQP